VSLTIRHQNLSLVGARLDGMLSTIHRSRREHGDGPHGAKLVGYRAADQPSATAAADPLRPGG
jgi:hypothetical protein